MKDCLEEEAAYALAYKLTQKENHREMLCMSKELMSFRLAVLIYC